MSVPLRMNYISALYNLDQSIIDENGDLLIPDGTNKFIKQVLNNETSLEDDNEFFKDVNSPHSV